MAPHCETIGFISASGASYTSSIGRHGTPGLQDDPSARRPRWARAPGASLCGTHVPPGLLKGPLLPRRRS